MNPKIRKGTLITIIVLLVIFLLLTVAGFYFHFAGTPDDVTNDNPNHEFHYNNQLWFYDEDNNLIGTYECTTSNCDYATSYINDGEYSIDSYVPSEGEDGLLMDSVINNQFVFLTDFESADYEAFLYDTRVIIEQGIEAREIEVAVLGNEDVRTTMAGEIVKDVAFYDYNSKYIDNKIVMQIPAQVPDEVQQKAQEYAKKAYTMLGGSGLSRCDFFLTNKNELFLNELNTMPGFTQFSMYPSLWEKMGLPYGDLIEELIQLGLNRFNQRQTLITEAPDGDKL